METKMKVRHIYHVVIVDKESEEVVYNSIMVASSKEMVMPKVAQEMDIDLANFDDDYHLFIEGLDTYQVEKPVLIENK